MRFSLFLLLCLVLAGCATKDSTEAYHPIERENGRLQWEQTSGDRLIANGSFSRDAHGQSAVRIGKEISILELRRAGGTLHAQGRMVRAGWSGEIQQAPRPVLDWAMLLQAWDAAPAMKEGKQELHTGAFRAQYEKQGGKLKTLFVKVNGTESNFTVKFFP